jgi:hypothetical protein
LDIWRISCWRTVCILGNIAVESNAGIWKPRWVTYVIHGTSHPDAMACWLSIMITSAGTAPDRSGLWATFRLWQRNQWRRRGFLEYATGAIPFKTGYVTSRAKATSFVFFGRTSNAGKASDRMEEQKNAAGIDYVLWKPGIRSKALTELRFRSLKSDTRRIFSILVFNFIPGLMLCSRRLVSRWMMIARFTDATLFRGLC